MSIVMVIVVVALLIVYGLGGMGRAFKRNAEWFVGLFKNKK